ncbi:MAG: hypothetical protein WAL25_12515 [Acidimicrobiia bacterium]
MIDRAAPEEGVDADDDHLAILRRMRTEGRISDEEFDELSGKSRPGSPNDAAPENDAAETDTRTTDTTEREDITTPSSGPVFRLRGNMTVGYLGAVLLAAGVLLIAGWAGVLSWWVTLPALLVLVTNLLDGWRRVTLVGAVVVTVLLVFDLAASAPSSTQVIQTVPTSPSTVPVSAPMGSLGIYMTDIVDAWNQVEGTPQIVRGLTRQNEIGEYDAFIYRFGESLRLAGAYDPEDDAVYALLVAGQFSDEATARLYLHLCFVVAPYSQDCIDSYHEQGLDGGDLTEFTGVSRNVEWMLGDQTWRLEIDQNVLTIRVFGADAA